LYLLHIR